MGNLAGLGPGGRVAGRYTLERELGRGGMGAVFVAKDDKFTARVALKLSDAGDPAGHDAFAARFRREAEIGHRLGRVEGFVRALDWGTIEGTTCLYLVMDLVDGARSLDLVGGPRRERLERLRRLARLVAEAHRQGVIHRDLKPANVLQRKDGALFLTDFGLAKVAGEPSAGDADPATVTQLTQTGVGMGTSLFMPPEQFEDAGSVDARADVFALGVMLFMALTGRAPFPGQSFQSVWVRQQKVLEGKEPAPRPSQVDATVPPDLDALCARALALKVEDRLQSAAALVDGLEAHLAGGDGSSSGTLTGGATTGGRVTAADPGSLVRGLGTSRAAGAGGDGSTIDEAPGSTRGTPAASGRPSSPGAAAASGRPSEVDERTLPWSPSAVATPAGQQTGAHDRTMPWAPGDPESEAERTGRGDAATLRPSARQPKAGTPPPAASACLAIAVAVGLLSVVGVLGVVLAWRRFRSPPPPPPVSLGLILQSPADGHVLAAATFGLRGRVDGWAPRPDPPRVAVVLGETTEHLDIADDGSFGREVDASRLPEGAHQLSVRLEGGPAITLGLIVDRTLPTVEVLAPQDGLRTGDARTTLRLEVRDATGPHDVEVTVDHVGDGATTQRLKRRLERPGLLEVPVDLGFGTTTLSITARDSFGHEASARRTVHRAPLEASLNVVRWVNSSNADLDELKPGELVDDASTRGKVILQLTEEAWAWILLRRPDGRTRLILPGQPVAPNTLKVVPNNPRDAIALGEAGSGQYQLVVVVSRAPPTALAGLEERLRTSPDVVAGLDAALGALPVARWRADPDRRIEFRNGARYSLGHAAAGADALVHVVRYTVR